MATGVGGGGTDGPGPPGAAAPRGAAARAAALGSVTLMRTPVTPVTACTARRASRASVAGSSRVSVNVKLTAPASSTTRSRTIPAATTSCPVRGFWRAARAV